MSRLIVLYKFNNYYNRIIKKLDTFQQYLDLITPSGNNNAPYRGFLRQNENFDIQDGVYAKHVINIAKNEPQYAKVDQPDYLVLEQSYKENNVTTTKVSRWFVLEAVKIRGNQFELSLRRDLLADFYSEVLQAPVFIEKGWLNNIDDPAIYNKETMTFNQIKKSELLLNDNKYSGNKGGWIVGYLARGTDGHQIQASGMEEAPADGYYSFDDLPATIQNMINAGEAHYYNTDKFAFGFTAKEDSLVGMYGGSVVNVDILSDTNNQKQISLIAFNAGLFPYPNTDYYLYFKKYEEDPFPVDHYWTEEEIIEAVSARYESTRASLGIKAAFATYVSNNLANNDFTTAGLLDQYQGIIYKKDNKYYRLSIAYDPYQKESYTPFIPTTNRSKHSQYTIGQVKSGSDNISTKFKTLLNGMIDGTTILDANGNQSKYCLDIGVEAETYILTSTEVTVSKAEVTIPNTRNKLYDAPYDMFCIPLGNVTVKNGNTTVLVTSGNVALPIARGIALAGTEMTVYDIQILPYCPFDEILDSQGNINISGFTLDRDYTMITETTLQTTYNVSIILFPKTCKGTFDIIIPTTNPNYSKCLPELNSPKEKKIKAETQFARFVSPNFASMFDINVQKNEGITELNVDFFYKPYSPYIHVAPYFKGLYGLDFNDPKGLICSGDFSISTASDQWSSYQIQNKNYELIFNRQIQNLDVNNSIAMEKAEFSGKLGVATAGLSGLAAGATAGGAAGPYGAAVGAAVGAVGGSITSYIGYKKDIEFLKAEQSETRSYQTDMYSYQLGNIQALPNTMTRVSAFTANNKIFPFIEFYDCTDEEKQALENKIKYNGMTIMRIGQIANFIGNEFYVQGQLIRLEGIDEDSHVISEIAKEIKEGAYFYGYNSI